jgi:hypothetical protein
MDVQAAMVVYWGQRLIISGSIRLRVKILIYTCNSIKIDILCATN